MTFTVCLVIKPCVHKGDRRGGKGREGKTVTMVNPSESELHFLSQPFSTGLKFHYF